MAERYPGYDVLAKWESPSFDDKTRAVVERRLRAIPERRFLSEAEWSLLEAVCARLIPQPDRPRPIPIVPWIDDMLAANRGEGFRHDGAPPMREVWRRGLAGLEAEAVRRHGQAFPALAPPMQDETLRGVQEGAVHAEAWAGLSAPHFFVQVLLKTVAGIYYAHPDAWSEIGFGGPASPRGYVRLGFDERDPWEARESR
jgi:hypothetical protein